MSSLTCQHFPSAEAHKMRNGKVENMSFLCALLVVFIHLNHVPKDVGSASWMIWYFIRYGLATIAVPFFFVVSGFFLAGHCDDIGWWRTAIRSRVKTLILPFFIWNALALACDVVLGYASADIKGLMNSFGMNPFSRPACGPLWFVRALCLFVVLSPTIIWSVKRWRWKILLVFYAVYLAVNPGHIDITDFWVCKRWQVFWRFGFPVEGLFYFSVGIYLRLFEPTSIKKVGLAGGIGLILVCARMCLKMCGLHDSGYLIPLAIPFMMIGIWQIVCESGWETGFARMSFPIYVMHPIILSVLAVLYEILMASSPNYGFVMMIEWALAVVVSIGCAYMLRTALPLVARVVFGGRC